MENKKTIQEKIRDSKKQSEYYKILVRTKGKKEADRIWALRDLDIMMESLEDLAEQEEALY